MEFKVTITETLKRTIFIDAETAEKAEWIAQEQYWRGDHVLTSEDYESTTFEADNENAVLNEMTEVIDRLDTQGREIVGEDNLWSYYATLLRDLVTKLQGDK